MKYRVGPNVSFVDAGRVYVEGDEIDKAAFKNEAALKSLIVSGKLTKLPPDPAAGAGGTTPAAGTGTTTPAAGTGDTTSPASEKGKDKK